MPWEEYLIGQNLGTNEENLQMVSVDVSKLVRLFLCFVFIGIPPDFLKCSVFIKLPPPFLLTFQSDILWGKTVFDKHRPI